MRTGPMAPPLRRIGGAAAPEAEAMRGRTIAALLAVLALAGGFAMLPAASVSSVAAPSAADLADGFFPDASAASARLTPLPATDRFLPAPAGTERDMLFEYGPVLVPPGSNINRVSVDLPPYDGFVTMYSPGMRDAVTGAAPDHEKLHLHHAHWLHIGAPGSNDYLPGLSWVFGTGGETTKANIDDRSAADPGGPRYGLFIPGGEPMVLVFMVHNFARDAAVLYLSVGVHWVYGSAPLIASAKDCASTVPVPGASGCAASQDFHALTGRLWGQSFDVPRVADGTDTFRFPPDKPEGLSWVAPWGATVIGTAGHMHENGKEIAVVNLGPEGSGCEADLDGDGFPGTTLLHSRKVDRVPEAWPHTHDFQMMTTKPQFRASIQAGDRIASYAEYANRDEATYDAMSYVGIYLDTQQAPPSGDAKDCARLAPILLPGGEGTPSEGVISKDWGGHNHGHLCGPAFEAPCDTDEPDRGAGQSVETVHIVNFAFTPGDRSMSGKDGAPVQVQAGKSLRFVNVDAAQGIMHAVTSCAWPCNGEHTGNYPQADGTFASGRLGNVDPIDGALGGPESTPYWDTPTDLKAGKYSYYCRMHPWMRGTFEVVGGDPAPPPEPLQPGSPGAGDSHPARATPGVEGGLALLAGVGSALAVRRRP